MPKPKPKTEDLIKLPKLEIPLQLAVTALNASTQDRMAYRQALIDLLSLYDRVAGNVSNGSGWTYADGKRMEEIRKLVASD